MTENYIQYVAGYQKDNINKKDISRAIKDIKQMDDEHGAFWVSVITDDENVIEVSKDLKLSFMSAGSAMKYQAKSWDEVQELYELLLDERFTDIRAKIA
jgi:rRNA maturation endonuclease Nob1